ncbi:cobalt ECF transporter T component CbiQ [Acidipropionibacterium virtanenii]|uniref:Cobalt transport protein CbiQ n=1 Tax=Acidipropionibacterium virtanenii TaxID=2057246 RepID=A0A344UWD3_9ACTN|nr:cobalt ECF transporter T component CbiQ [Acidipropionibacterium virtanenii]AXE39581.1 Cobalt transport protein CbiQ [Acidipropionibacterium virtanenii]
MSITSLDDAAWDSPWRRRPVGEKVGLSVGLIVVALCTPAWPGTLFVSLIALVAILGFARIRPRVLWQAMSAPIVFLILGGVSVLVSVGTSQDPAAVWWRGGIFAIGPVSARQGANLVAHGLAGTLALMILALTTPMVDLLTWMRRLHVPDALLEIASLTYRLIFVLLDTVFTAHEAQKCRLGDAPVGRLNGYRRRFENTAALMGSVGVRAWARSNRLNDGLVNRGFEDSLLTLPVQRVGTWKFKVVTVLVIAGSWAACWPVAGRLWR